MIKDHLDLGSEREPSRAPKTSGNISRRGALLTLLATVSCNPGTLGKAVRPEDPTAAQVMGEQSCAMKEDYVNPLIVDWKTQQREDIEIAMRQKERGLIVVSYDCKTLEVLPNCSVDSSYDFMPTSRTERTFQLSDMNELQANLPTFGERIGLDIGVGTQSHASIDVALITVGRVMTARTGVSRALLRGDCGRATHFVRGATLGAFSMQTGTKGQVRTAAQLFGAGAMADSTSEKKVSEKSGSLEACLKATTEMDKPPSNCNAPVRLHLTAIGKEVPITVVTRPSVKAAQNDPTLDACPQGMVMAEGKCAKRVVETHQCHKENEQDCSAQCDAGHMGSCLTLGEILDNRSLEGDKERAVTLFKKACDSGIPQACSSLGLTYLLGHDGHRDVVRYHELMVRTLVLYQAECNTGVLKSCVETGHMMEYPSSAISDYVEQIPKSEVVTQVVAAYKKACAGGIEEGCERLSHVYIPGFGLPRDCRSATRILTEECNQGLSAACEKLGEYYERRLFSIACIKKNDTEAIKYFRKACELKLSRACRHADHYGVVSADTEGGIPWPTPFDPPSEPAPKTRPGPTPFDEE